MSGRPQKTDWFDPEHIRQTYIVILTLGLCIITLISLCLWLNKAPRLEPPPVHVEEKDGKVTFTVTSVLYGDHDAMMLIRDKAFTWELHHWPEKTVDMRGEVTVSVTYNIIGEP